MLLQNASLSREYARTRKAARCSTTGTPIAAQASFGGAELVLEGQLWRVPAKRLEEALHAAHAAGTTPLLLDPSPLRAVDAYFEYGQCTVVHAKRLVLDVRAAKTPLPEARDGLST